MYDLTRSYRAAAGLAGCSPHTVADWVARRERGELGGVGVPVRRDRLVDRFMPKIEEWVDRSEGKIRGDVCYDRLRDLGFSGSPRTVRRAVAEVKAAYRAGRRRVYRPWITEPGMWAQWDWGQGPSLAGRVVNLFCAWLAWSRHRVVIPTWDRTLPTVIACLDRCMRVWGGAPTYWLTDNERTVTTGHVAGVPVRHPMIVKAGLHYGVTITTCVPADPETKGGSEAAVRVAKADLVPTQVNLRPGYGSWAELVDACGVFTDKVNNRAHRVTRRPPVEMLAEEQHRLHPLPVEAYTAAFGETRKVSWSSTISYGGVTYSVPHTLAGETVWTRVDGDEIVAVHTGETGAVEVARHARSTPGNPVIDDDHYPPRPDGPAARQPRATNPTEAEFLAIGDGARAWLIEAAAAGTARIRVKMSEAVTLARLHGPERVDTALGQAAIYQRFAEGDLTSLLDTVTPGTRRRANDTHSLQTGTKAWQSFGATPNERTDR